MKRDSPRTHGRAASVREVLGTQGRGSRHGATGGGRHRAVDGLVHSTRRPAPLLSLRWCKEVFIVLRKDPVIIGDFSSLFVEF